ncbi:MAG: hypothetical protein J6Y02_14745 [Pseudobutyrivibrio sp.]|nr:hypothetical protein [Pseudobutyrivibrio sp.]
MNKEQALASAINDINRVGLMPNLKHWRARILPVLSKYVNVEYPDALVHYIDKRMYKITALEQVHEALINGKIGTTNYKARQLLAMTLDYIRIINTKMMQEVYAGTWTLEAPVKA